MPLDHFIIDWCQAHQWAPLTSLLRVVSLLTSGESVAIWAGFIWLILTGMRHFRPALVLLLGTLLGISAVVPMKLLFGRVRPLIEGHPLAPSFAFPSGHATSSMIFFSLATWLALQYKPERKLIYISLAATVITLTGLSRIYLGFHWPTDVLGGYAFGGLYTYLWLHFASHRLLDSRKRAPSKL